MITENLNEMIKQNAENPVGVTDPDYVYTLSKRKLMYDDVEEELLNAGKPVTDSGIPQVEDAKKANVVKLPSNNYQPESEEALIRYTMSIHKKVQTYSIGGYWEIGRTINSFYPGEYGAQELEKISKAIGIGRDTLNKMCKFARQYSREQVESLLSGAFPVCWLQISQNLAVAPDKMIQAYQETGDPKQFHNQIMKLKDPKELRGKSKSASAAVQVAVSEPSIIINGVTEPPVLNDAPFEKNTAMTGMQVSNDQVNELDDLRAKNTKLREDFDHKEYKINQLQKLLYDSALEKEPLRKEILAKDAKIRILEKELSDVQREKEKYENSHYAYMDKMDKIRVALENNTPAKAILAWLDQGDDE